MNIIVKFADVADVSRVYEHEDAYRRFGLLTVAGARRLSGDTNTTFYSSVPDSL